MPFSTFMDNAILNEFFGGTNYAPPTNVHVALSTTAPTKAGGNVTEPTGGAYARVQVANNATNFPAASSSSKSNGANISFPEATASWGTVTHWAIFDAATGGNLLAYGALGSSKTVDIGDAPYFSPSTLTLTLS